MISQKRPQQETAGLQASLQSSRAEGMHVKVKVEVSVKQEELIINLQ